VEIYRLMAKVYEALEDKSLFFCDDLDYVEQHMEKSGFGVVAVVDEKIAGSLICRYPGMDEDNLGRDISLAEEELEAVVHMESAVVDISCRGRGLQCKMLQYAESLIDNEKYRHLLATVSPYNPASLRSFEKNGYGVRMTKEKYGGLLRSVLYKRVEQVPHERGI